MVSEREIRESFLRVRQDIENLHKQISGIDEKMPAGEYADKKEFDAFIKALDAKLKELQSGLVSQEHLARSEERQARERERQKAALEKAIQSAKPDLTKQDKSIGDITAQLKQTKNALEKAAELESKLSKLSLEYAKKAETEAAIWQARKETEKQIESIKNETVSAKKAALAAEARAADVPDFGRLTKRLQELEDKAIETRKLVKEADISELKKELAELTSEFSKLNKKYVQWNDLSKSEKESKKQAEELRNETRKLRETIDEASRHEVDLGDYLLKQEMKETMKGLKAEMESYRKEKEKLQQRKNEETEKRLREAKAGMLDLKTELDIISTRQQKETRQLREEIENTSRKENRRHPEELREKDEIGTYITVLVAIILIVAAGYYIYTSFRQPAAPQNPQLPATMSEANRTTAMETERAQPPTQPNITETAGRANATGTMPNSTEGCVLKYECLRNENGKLNFDCYFDANESGCKCITEGIGKCPQEKTDLLRAKRAGNATDAGTNKSVPPSGSEAGQQPATYLIYGVAAVSVIIFVILFIYLFRKGEEAAREEEKAKEPEEKLEQDVYKQGVEEMETLHEIKEDEPLPDEKPKSKKKR